MKRLIFLLFLLGISWCAQTSVTGYYDDADFDTDFYFTAGERFSVDFSCNVIECSFSSDPADCILEGNPCSGSSKVCPGTKIELTPSVSGRWATSGYLDIFAPYPYCDPVIYCPEMESYSSKSEKSVKWLSADLFNEYDAEHGGHTTMITGVGPEGIPYYNELATFHTQSVDYWHYYDEPVQRNKKGYANIFAKGWVDVKKGTLGTGFSVTDIEPVQITLPCEETATIRTTLMNVDTFAALVKHPKDDTDHTDMFRIFFFGYAAPSVSQIYEEKSIVVENVQPSLRVESVSVHSGATHYLLHVSLYNDGDVPVEVTRVLPQDPGWAKGFGGGDCELYGFPPAVCPSDSGFEDTINPGGTHTVYVIYRGELEGDIVELVYEPLAKVCSAETTFRVAVHVTDGETATRCSIEPSSVSVTPGEINEWAVTCYNSLDTEVPCVGNNWGWADVSGVFIDRTNEYAQAYVTGPPGGRPYYTLTYKTDSVYCNARIYSPADEPEGSGDPYSLVCELVPDSAGLDLGESQTFELVCTLEGTPVTPDSADYSNVNGLDGSLSGASTDGVTFTATVDNVTGDVQVIAWYNNPVDDTLRGAIDWAHVIVGEGGEEPPEDGEGEEICEITLVPAETYPHGGGRVGILCISEDEKTICRKDIRWEISPDLYGSINGLPPESGHMGAAYNVGETDEPGPGTYISAITAHVLDSDEEVIGSCYADVLIKEPTCLEYT